jgi:hypothetical protein
MLRLDQRLQRTSNKFSKLKYTVHMYPLKQAPSVHPLLITLVRCIGMLYCSYSVQTASDLFEAASGSRVSSTVQARDLHDGPSTHNLSVSISYSHENSRIPVSLLQQSITTKMSNPALNKIAANSPSRTSPSEIETSIATALHDLETNIPDMRSSLRPLQFVTAREVR